MYQISTLPQTTRSERGGKHAESARINRRLAAAGSLRSAALQQSNSKLLRKKKCTTYPRAHSAIFPFGRKDSKKTRQGERSRGHLGNQGNPPRAEMATKLFFFFSVSHVLRSDAKISTQIRSHYTCFLMTKTTLTQVPKLKRSPSLRKNRAVTPAVRAKVLSKTHQK